MQSIILPRHEKRFFLALLIVAVLAYVFWTTSRYPALDEKAVMAGAIQLEDSLSFEAKFPVGKDAGIVERIFWSTLNWVNTNKKGMSFGVLFATAMLTALAYLRQRSFRGGFANSVLGMLIGAPLGVCANCAAPIGRGMYAAGLRAETTLSAMVASPTLNVVVLTMLFSLFPPYMAAMKIGLSLVVILLVVPLVVRALPVREVQPQTPDVTGLWQGAADPGAIDRETLPGAVLAVIVAFVRNFWYITRLTVPLMLLAGLLGALVATLLPSGMILSLQFSVGALILIAIVGVFLPVPIAFDIVMASALLSLGLAHGYVMALLFTLGAYSIYSALIVTQAMGRRAAVLMGTAIAVLGILGGGAAQWYHDWQTDRALKMLLEESALRQPVKPRPWGAAQAAGHDPWRVTSPDAAHVAITPTPFKSPSPAADQPFTRMEARAIGIDMPLEFFMRDMWPPFWEGRSLSSGDIDRDGDLDLVAASSEQALYLYENDGSGRFTRRDLPLGPIAELMLFNAALVDLDNDGWLDLVLASYLDGSWMWKNVNGSFGPAAPVKLANRDDTPLAIAMSFADADENGFVDIAMGNWAAGWYRRIPGEESRNRILWNDAGLPGARVTDLPGIPGETLSILFSDFNADGHSDLIVGNDFDIPDYFYSGDGKGGFAMIDHDSGLIPHTTTTTMAVKTGDLDGDGFPEIYLAQIAGRSSGVSENLKMQDIALYCDTIVDPESRAICEKNMAIKAWYRSGNNFDPSYASKCARLSGRYKDECRAMLVKDLAIQKRDPGVCKLIPKGQRVPRAYCDLHFKPIRPVPPAEGALTHQQILRSNVLLKWNGSAWDDTAEKDGLEVGGWSWDTKLADFDLDGDMDVYIVNGTWVPNEVTPSNLYFENDGHGHFQEMSGPAGLEDYLMTAAATRFDADGDGDLDILTHPVNGPLIFFRNNTQAVGIGFALEDRIGNRDGIGALITITDATGRSQSREMQLGGGFMSFDALHATFGLGGETEVTRVSVRWADGAETVIEGRLPAGHLYTITRG